MLLNGYNITTTVFLQSLMFLIFFLFRIFVWTTPCLECYFFPYNLFITSVFKTQHKCHFLKNNQTNKNNFMIQLLRLGLIPLINSHCPLYICLQHGQILIKIKKKPIMSFLPASQIENKLDQHRNNICLILQ